MEQKTFSINIFGEKNPEISWIERRLNDGLESVIDDFVKNCMENNVEDMSAKGLLMNQASYYYNQSWIDYIANFAIKNIDKM